MINLKLLYQSVRPVLIIVTHSRKDILPVVGVLRCWSRFWAKAALQMKCCNNQEGFISV